MPLSTANPKFLNLPDNRTSPAQPSPYIQVYGTLKTNKSKESTLIISIGKDPEIISYTYNISTQETTKKESTVKLKLEKKNYKIKDEDIFDLYVKSGIIDSDGTLIASQYNKIISNFIDYVKSRKLENAPVGLLGFSIFLIPSADSITYENNRAQSQSSQSFKDSFGNDSDGFPSEPTKTSKFLSYDDRAFTLNCKQKSEFYQNIGIGNKSFEKIFFPKDQTFTIAQMNWVFTDISSSQTKFAETKRGIYHQLYENYRLISDQKNTTKTNYLSLLKTICYKQQQAKQEILIDENLTMQRMDRLFGNVSREEIPFLAFEILIETNGKSVLWNNYLNAIKNFLNESKIPKDYLLNIFSRMLRTKIHDWLKEKKTEEQRDFFTRSDFCLKTLCTSREINFTMNDNEKFAFNIGKIARNWGAQSR